METLEAGQHATYKGRRVEIVGFKSGQVKIKYYTASGRPARKTVDAEMLSDIRKNPVARQFEGLDKYGL